MISSPEENAGLKTQLASAVPQPAAVILDRIEGAEVDILQLN